MGGLTVARKHWREAAEGQSREGSESVLDQSVALDHLGDAEKSHAFCQQIIQTTDKDEAIGKFLLSQAYECLGEKTLAAESMKQAREQDANVVLKARIEASYIPLR